MRATIAAASAPQRTSPLPVTGTRTASFTRAITPQSARPRYSCSAKRPCTATIAAPASSMRRANSGAVSSPSTQPRRNFTATGCSTARATARTMSAASAGSFMSADPSPFDTILRAGQPMLMSR